MLGSCHADACCFCWWACLLFVMLLVECSFRVFHQKELKKEEDPSQCDMKDEYTP